MIRRLLKSPAFDWAMFAFGLSFCFALVLSVPV